MNGIYPTEEGNTQKQYDSLYQVNTRVWLRAKEAAPGVKSTLDDVTDAELDELSAFGFQWIWLLSVWTTGPLARGVSLAHAGWQTEFQHTLPDLQDDDIGGSGFAIAAYEASPDIGGREALARFRDRLRARGMKLMLDFVPNHMGPDHAWVAAYPDFFVQGTKADLDRQPQNYTVRETTRGPVVFAYGRDPYFDGWPDTIQLDYSNPDTIAAMQAELLRIAGQCDGVRCDMAMLVLPEVFLKTWGRKAMPFWPDAIRTVRDLHPGFCFMAEVYWDMEWELQQLGFDYTYDKRLYDRLHLGKALPVVQHLFADENFQRKSVRFLENHDEPRAATAFYAGLHQAAAVITYTIPGLRFFHQGQLEGRRVKVSPHLVRAPQEQTDSTIAAFYRQLLALIRRPALREGNWTFLNCRQAWSENPTHEACIAYRWKGRSGEQILVAVNFSGHQSQCYVSLPFPELGGRTIRLTDVLSDAVYERDGNDLIARGLYLDVHPWQYHIFDIR